MKKKKRLPRAEYLAKKEIRSTVKHAKNNERSQPYEPKKLFQAGLTVKQVNIQRSYANNAIRNGWIHNLIKKFNSKVK